MFTYTVLIVLIPLVFFILIGFFGHKVKPVVAGIFGTTGLFISMALSYYTAYQYFFNVPRVADVFQKVIGYNTVWLQLTQTLHIDLGVLLDPISVMMLIVITTISTAIRSGATAGMWCGRTAITTASWWR